MMAEDAIILIGGVYTFADRDPLVLLLPEETTGD